MSEKENKQLIQIPAEKLVDALLHAKQFEQHYATQESVDNLKERMDSKFEQVNTRFEQINDRFEQINDRFEQVSARFEQFNEKLTEYRAEVNQRFLQVDRRFDEIREDNRHTNNKLDRLQWFIVAAALAFIFKDYVFKSLAGI